MTGAMRKIEWVAQPWTALCPEVAYLVTKEPMVRPTHCQKPGKVLRLNTDIARDVESEGRYIPTPVPPSTHPQADSALPQARMLLCGSGPSTRSRRLTQ